ncbi:UNVERIFIED_ORG: phage tail tape measure protein [Bacillus sp. AZ43]
MTTLLGEARIRVRPSFETFHSEADRQITSSFKKIAATAGAALGAAGVAAFAASTINIGKTYQSTLNNLQAVSNASAGQMAAVSREAKALGSDLTLTSTSAADAATAMTELAKGGLNVDEAMKAARGTLQLAAAAGIEAGQAAEIQSAALNAFNLEADQAGRVADVLANAANAAAGEITDFGLGMSQASAVAAATGISLEDTAATLGLLANNGIRGSDAGTLLKSALLALQAPSGPAASAMERLSLSAYDASGNFVGLSSLFGQLAEAQKRMTPQAYANATAVLFGSDAARLAGIAGREGSKGFDAMAEAMGRSGSAAEVAEAKAKGVGGAMEAFTSQLETLQIEIFDEVAPSLEALIRSSASLLSVVTDVIGVVSDIPGPVWAAVAALTAWRLGGERITGAFSSFRDALKRVGEESAVQQALYRQQASGLSSLERALLGVNTGASAATTQLSAAQMTMRGWDAELSRTAVAMDTVANSAGRFGGVVAGMRAAGTGLLGLFGGPLGLAITGVTLGLSFLVPALIKSGDAADEAALSQSNLKRALEETEGAIDATVRAAAAKDLVDSGLNDWARKIGLDVPVMTDALLGVPGAMDQVSGAFRRYSDANKVWISDESGYAAQVLNDQGNAAQRAMERFLDLAGLAPETVRTQKEIAEAVGITGGAMGTTVAQSEKATEAIEKWREQLAGIADSFVDPLATYQEMVQDAATKTAEATSSASDSWRDYVADTDVSLDEFAVRLQEQLTDQANWRTNLGQIAQWAGQDVAQHLAAMGEEGVGLVAQMADGTSAEAQRAADLIRQKLAAGSAGTIADFDNFMKIMAALGASGGQATANEIATQLGIGLGEVSRIAASYGVALAGGINPVLRGLGKKSIEIDQQAGRLYRGVIPEFYEGGYTGDGGKYEPKGVVHGGEFVFTKEETRQAGVPNLVALAKSLRGYATGGFVSVESVPKPPSTAPYQSPISTAADATMEKGYNETRAWLAANLEPPATSGGSSTGLLPIMAAARQYVMDTYGIRNIGGFARRNIAGTNTLSDHALGKAIDIMTTNLTLGWAIANDFAFGPAHSRFKAENVIWQQSISSRGGPFKGMADRGSPTQNHRDHVHVDTYDEGGILPPGLTLVNNASGKPEAVFNNDQWATLRGLADNSSAPLVDTLNINVGKDANVRDGMESAMFELRRIKRGGRLR